MSDHLIIGYGVNTNVPDFWRKDAIYNFLGNHMCSTVFNALTEFYKENSSKYRLSNPASVEKLANDFAEQYESIDEENAGETGPAALIADMINEENHLKDSPFKARNGYIYVTPRIARSKEERDEFLIVNEINLYFRKYLGELTKFYSCDVPVHMYNIN